MLSAKDEALLNGRDAFLLLDLFFDFRDLVALINVELNLLAGEGTNSGNGKSVQRRVKADKGSRSVESDQVPTYLINILVVGTAIYGQTLLDGSRQRGVSAEQSSGKTVANYSMKP